MPVRTFDRADDNITTALGSLGFAFGPGTIAAIIRRAADSGASETVFKAGVSSIGARYQLNLAANGQIQLQCGSSLLAAAGVTVAAADGWCLIAGTKATGTVAARIHKYVFSTETWTHADSSTTGGNSGVPATSARIGATHTPSVFFGGDIGILAVSDAVLNDAAIEALVADEAAWDSAGFVAKWMLDQASTATAVDDDIGTADQSAITGTSVTSTDIPWTGGSAGTFSGTIAQTLPAVTQAAAGTHTAPSFTGTAGQTLPSLTQAAAGAVTPPEGTGVIAQTLPSLTQAASGTHTVPTFVGAAAQSLPALTQSVTGSTQPPTFTADAAQVLPAMTQTVVGAVSLPARTGTAAQELPALTQTATGGYAPPTFSAVIAQTLPMLTQSLTNRKPVVTTTLGVRGAPSLTLGRRADRSLALSTRPTPTLEVT